MREILRRAAFYRKGGHPLGRLLRRTKASGPGAWNGRLVVRRGLPAIPFAIEVGADFAIRITVLFYVILAQGSTEQVRHSRESGNPVTFRPLKTTTLDPRFRGDDEAKNYSVFPKLIDAVTIRKNDEPQDALHSVVSATYFTFGGKKTLGVELRST